MEMDNVRGAGFRASAKGRAKRLISAPGEADASG